MRDVCYSGCQPAQAKSFAVRIEEAIAKTDEDLGAMDQLAYAVIKSTTPAANDGGAEADIVEQPIVAK